MSKEVKVKILEMAYDQDNNLFQMKIEELVGDHKTVTLAVAGRDFGIHPKIPPEVIQRFCEDMIGKEKNLHIQKDTSSVTNKDMPFQDMTGAYDDTMGYPIGEVMNSIHSKSKENGDEN